ncbi:phosphoesterase PA-phosphatase [Pantoea alhagi]|uniref:Phosphoesterase PA-phosphatase n=1 Tax=Pantoea alhagi TaxID=1891675 RepID=A0A1W6B2H5_9GAMM|nr:phosphatase PAP2 family protein [Pantoea alhagi]ARJ41295.1 phosphoesterase PA-phosphatase [Pantoea alhagi]
MRIKLTLLSAVLLSGTAAAASFDTITAIVDSTTPASDSPAFVRLENHSLLALRQAIQGSQPQLRRDELQHAKQDAPLADKAWLKASGYDFAVKQQQQTGIALLESFNRLPSSVMDASLQVVTRINRDATAGERQQALADAEGINYLYFLSDALGPKLGQAFLNAYNKGELAKAAALIKATEISTSAAKDYFHYPRPFLQSGNQIHLVPDDVVIRDGKAYSATGGAFPSGHTNTGYTDALLLAEMVPERFVPLIDRGARYGYSRVILGVHYPLDVMGSRMIAERNVAHFMNDPAWRKLFAEAKTELRSALSRECGSDLQTCAQNPIQDDPYRDPAMAQFYRFTMTYSLPQATPHHTALTVPAGAEVLLEPVLPQLSAAQRRALMQKTALADGYPLSGGEGEQNFWQRLNLHDAITAAR